MKIRVPVSVKFGCRVFPIVFNPDLSRDNGHLGETHFRPEKIELDAHLSNSNRVITLLHEVMHIISDQYQCELNEDNADRLAEGVADLLVNSFGLEFDWSGIEHPAPAETPINERVSTKTEQTEYYADKAYQQTNNIGKGTTCYDCVMFPGEVCFSERGTCEDCVIYKHYKEQNRG